MTQNYPVTNHIIILDGSLQAFYQTARDSRLNLNLSLLEEIYRIRQVDEVLQFHVRILENSLFTKGIMLRMGATLHIGILSVLKLIAVQKTAFTNNYCYLKMNLSILVTCT